MKDNKERIKRHELASDIANYIYSQEDHNTREVTDLIMKIIDSYQWWVSQWHKLVDDLGMYQETFKTKKEVKK